MKLNLIKQNDGYFIREEGGGYMGRKIERNKGESDDDYEKRAIIEFKEHCKSMRGLKRTLMPKIIATEYT